MTGVFIFLVCFAVIFIFTAGVIIGKARGIQQEREARRGA